MSRFATGVVIISVGGGHIHAMTANAFASVSLAPPSVLCSIAHDAVMHKAITAAGNFAVSILGARQRPLAAHFADKRRPLGAAQFADVSWRPGPRTGAPLITDALAWLECEVTDAHDSADHTIFIGTVLSAGPGPEREALLFFEGAYGHVAPTGTPQTSTE